MSEWRIDELAQRAGVAVDTIRYYQREGLLPAGERSGRSMRYGPAISNASSGSAALQARRFSLAAIQALLDHDGGPTSLETLLAGRVGRDLRPRRARRRRRRDASTSSAGSSRSGCSASRRSRSRRLRRRRRRRAPLVRRPRAASACPTSVLVELARILNDGIESVQQQTAAVFHGEQGPDWGRRGPRAVRVRDGARSPHASCATCARSPTTCSTATSSASCSASSASPTPRTEPEPQVGHYDFRTR